MTIQDELITTIADLVQPGKGILAADESTPTIAKRFKAVMESTKPRREYRSIIFHARPWRAHQRRDSVRRNPGTTEPG